MMIPVDLMVHIISTSKECKEYLSTKYPYEYEIWSRFSEKNGPQCAFARAAIKRIFNDEHKSRGQEFLSSLGSQLWGSTNYQVGSC